MDVNDPDNCKLLRYINLPSRWATRAGSGFDTFLIEQTALMLFAFSRRKKSAFQSWNARFRAAV